MWQRGASSSSAAPPLPEGMTMAEVTLVHPVTGATKTVSEERAALLRANGWVGGVAPTRRPIGEPEVPNIAAGRAALDAQAGRPPKHVEPVSQRKPARRAKKVAAPHPSEVEGQLALFEEGEPNG